MKYFPIIRHLRYFFGKRRLNQHNNYWQSLGLTPISARKDYEFLDAIWRGKA